MTTTVWNIEVDEEMHKVEVALEGFSGKLTVKIDDDTFELPPKFLTILFGRREHFKLGEKLSTLHIKPFGRVTIIVGGKTYE
jgi:hypothetical protein